jgi:ferredoxin
MDRPCIVCQENCPVSPKAIMTQTQFSIIHKDNILTVKGVDTLEIELLIGDIIPEHYATGDYYLRIHGQGDEGALQQIIYNSEDTIIIASSEGSVGVPSEGTAIEIVIRLQQPLVDPEHCIGCGICQHECPVKGKRAIRVSAENETRNRDHRLLI